jgi:hypothetical protein
LEDFWRIGERLIGRKNKYEKRERQVRCFYTTMRRLIWLGDKIRKTGQD